jgi:hypothetical protein
LSLLYSRAVVRTRWLVVPIFLAAASCSGPPPDVETAVRGNGDTGRYEATITNNTDADLYVTCTVTALLDYGAVGSDRFILRAIAGAATDRRGAVSLDDAPARYEIECAKELSIDANAGGPLDEDAAGRACSATERLYRATDRMYPDEATPTQRVQMAAHVRALAGASGDPALIAASERLADDPNSHDGNVWHELFTDIDDACEAIGLNALGNSAI